MNSNNIEQIDQHDGMVLYHFNDDTHQNSSDDTKQCRGLIYKDNKLVCKSYPWTLLTTDEQYIRTTTAEITYAHEGTVLRVFNVDDKWYISTHKKINAFNSKWGYLDKTETFGELFYKYVDGKNVLKKLNKNYCYMFLLYIPYNRICCRSNEYKLYHVTTYDKNMIEIKNTIQTIPKIPNVDKNIDINSIDLNQYYI